MLERAKDFILSRRGKIAPIVTEKLKKLLDKHPNTEKVYLLGSYANGDWVDEQTPEWFKDFRRSIGKRKHISDVDFYVEPWVPPIEGEYDVLDFPRGSQILIYDNGKTIL